MQVTHIITTVSALRISRFLLCHTKVSHESHIYLYIYVYMDINSPTSLRIVNDFYTYFCQKYLAVISSCVWKQSSLYVHMLVCTYIHTSHLHTI